MAHGRRVLVIGAGDLGTRVSLRLASQRGVAHVAMAGRDVAAGTARARFVASCGDATVDFEPVDALDSRKVAALIRRVRPDLTIHSAALHSPWILSGRDDPVARALRSAGFASHLAAQLPLLLAVMRGVRDAAPESPVVNCSYPDVTHPMLSALGLAPTVGAGNAGMIHVMVQSHLRHQDDGRRLRTLAHHSHVSMVAAATLKEVPATQRPRLFLDETEVSIADVLADVAPIPLSRELNEIAAAHAAQLVSAFLGVCATLHTAAPGVAGLPGGWPVTVGEGRIELDLPRGLTREQVLAFNHAAARRDGIAHLGEDGTAHFTDELRQALSPHWSHLADPLHPQHAQQRYEYLRMALRQIR